MIREISAADYGREDDAHFHVLKPIWLEGSLGWMDSWYPREVLELMRWSEPDDPEWKPGGRGLRGHLMRAFCCAVLLATPNVEPEKETLIQMLESIFVIGADAMEAAVRFLVWRVDPLGYESDRPFFVFGIAALLHGLDPEMPMDCEEELARWVADAESSERGYLSELDDKDKAVPWLLGLSFSDMRNEKWRALISRLMAECAGKPLGELLKWNVGDELHPP